MGRLHIIWIIPIFLLWVVSSANIIDIPDDYQSIQDGINAGVDGDTVLVQPGTYFGNINFNGRNIVLGSLFLMTRDTTHIEETIIDANYSGTAITIASGENPMAKVIGMTVQNGLGILAGGIVCMNSNPRVENNIIVSNNTNTDNYNSGAGVYCENSNAIIRDNVIRDNEALLTGAGGVFCLNASPTISRNMILNNIGGGIQCYPPSSPMIEGNIIAGNSTFFEGGGILCYLSNPTLINNTIYNNSAGSTGGGINIIEAYPQIINCILWDNMPSQIYLYLCSPSIRYCDIQGGWQGEGNVDCYPMFCDIEENHFYLAENSCCVGAGEYGEDIGALGIGCAPTEFDDEYSIPSTFSIPQNYPNPFNATTHIFFSLPEPQPASLTIYDLLGRKIITLADDYLRAGGHNIAFDASDLASGIYFYRLQAGETIETKRMVLLK